MESFPLEYVLHHVPLYAFAGLLDPPPPPLPAELERDSPAFHRAVQDHTAHAIKKSLLDLLLARNDANVWDTRSPKTLFRVLALERSFVFPPRKPPAKALSMPSQTSSSPLSPLNPASPLFPDGIMAPQWVHKHREAVPSVVVAVCDLWESIDQQQQQQQQQQQMASRRDPLGVQQVSALERDRDQILAQEINEKRKNASEHGLKFAAIIIVKTHRADDPVIEERISFIRRAAMLDRNNQFTYSAYSETGSPPDLNAFLEMTQRGLFELSSIYYRDHEKRIKRKRARLSALSKPQGSASPNPGASSALPGAAVALPPGIGMAASGASASGPTMAVGALGSLGVASAAPVKQLSLQGWNVRYDYKLGVIAEFRQDIDVALRYYDTAYHGIINILHQSQAAAGALAPGGGGTSAVPEISPGSLRWTEACTFADALSVKIFKLLLYTNHSLTALMQLHKHFVHCRDFSEFAFINTSFETSPRPSVQVSGLGHLTAAAGGGSYKYWAWASTHYRAFGELIEIASAKTKLVLPYPPPGSTANQAQSLLNVVSNTGFNFMAGEAAASMFSPFSSVNPVFTVQHAGFYYLLAARCAEERWSKFKKATAVEALIPRRSISLHEVRTHNRLSSFDANNAAEISPDLATERTVDHAMIVIELLTKSYEHFKKFKNSRLTLYLASDIARVYEEGGKYDMALKFFERIGKTYRKESWFSVLGSINRIMIKCAQQLGLHQTRLECLVELLCEQLTPDAEGLDVVYKKLLGILSGSGGDVPSDAIAALAGGVPLPSELSVQLDMDQLAAFVECGVQFRVPQAHVLETVAYQIHIATRSAMSPPTPLPVARILVEFSNSDFDLCLLPIDGESAAAAQRPRVDLVACHDATRHAAVCPPAEGRDKPMWVKRARLDVSAGCSTVYEGSVTASDNQELRIQTVRLVLESGGRRIDLVFKISERPVAALGVKRRWLTRTAADAPLRFVDLPGNGEQSVVRIDQRKPKIDIKFDYVTPVYLDEAVPINLHLHSHESEPMRVFFTFKLGMGVDPGVGGVGGGPSDPLAQFAQNLPDLHSLAGSASVSASAVTAAAQSMASSSTTASSGATLSRKRSTTHAAAQIAPTQVDLGTLDPDKPFAAQFFIRTFGRPGPRTLQGTIHAYFVSQPLSTTTSATPGSSSPAMQLDLSDTRLLSKHSSDDATDVLVFEQPFEVAAEIAQSANPALEIEALTGLLGPAGNGSGGNGGGGDGDVDVDVLVDPKRIFEWNLSAALKLVGSWDVEVEHATLTTTHLSNPSSVLVAVREVSQPEGGKVWHQNHVHNYAFNITTAVEALSASTKVDIGSLAVRWRRLKPETGDWVRTVVEMPKADVHSEILRIYADIPGEIYVGRPFKLRYVIQNTTLHLAELVTFVESSEHFVFAGYKQRHYRVLPLSTRVLSFHVMPLTSGRCALPVVKTMKRTDAAALAGKDATGSGSQIGIDLAAREKVFAVCCGKMHSHGSKHGELYVHVQPTAGW